MSESPSSSSLASDQVGESPTVDLIGKIMVVIIILLFMVVVSTLVVHLYAKVFWWRRTSQGQSRPPSVVALGTVTALDPLVLKTLPVSVFQPHDSSSKENGVECSVCLSELVEGEKLRVLPKCNHGFHVDCIDTWFKSHATCPLCRTLVVALPQPTDLESQSFPTNVLIWGNQTQITSSSSTTAASLEESTSSNTTSTTSRHDRMLVIDIPKQVCIVSPGSTSRFAEDSSSSSATATTSRFAEDGLKSPVLRRLRSLRRLLSNNKLNPWTPTSSTQTTTKGGEEGHN